MSLASDTTSVVAQGTQAAMPKDTRPPALRLRAYRADVFRLGAARARQCEQAWWDLDHAPVLFRVQAPAQEEEETKTDEHPPSAPPGRVAIVRARLQARGASSLRREVRPIEDTPAAVAHHHHQQGRRPDALLAGALRAPRPPGQPKGGLYGARRAPTTASPRAQTAPMRAPTIQARRAHISKEDIALLAMDIDEEPSHTARPTGRALAERLYRKSDTMRSDVEVATVASPEPTSPAPKDGQMLPMRKRGRDEADDALEAAPYAKRLAKPDAKQARFTPGSPSAESGIPVGRHVQQPNHATPPPSSRAPSGTPAGFRTRGLWARWMIAAWTAIVRALAMVTARLASQVEAPRAN